MDCWPPCSPWCVCVGGACQKSPVAVNGVRFRTQDGRYLQASNGGGAVLVATTVANPAQWETFRFEPPTVWPLSSGDKISLNLCNSNWDPSGQLVRVDHGVKTFPPRKGTDRLVSYEVGGPGQAVWVRTNFGAGYPAYSGDDPVERIFDITKPAGGVINDGDLVSLRINSNFGKTFFFRTTGAGNGAEIDGDGTFAGQAGTVFKVEFVEVRSGLGVRPPAFDCQSCATVDGTVTRAAGGQPIGGASVVALDVLENHSFANTSAANGTFTLRDTEGRTCIPAGDIKVQASADRYKTKTIAPVAVPGAGSVNVPIHLDCTQVTVKVVDSAGLAMPGVTVMLFDSTGLLLLTDVNGQAYVANTGLNGSVTFNCVPHGTVQVQTTADPSQHPQLLVPEGGASVTIVVQNTCGNVVGRVVQAGTAVGVPNATVTLAGVATPATTDANGNFTFPCVRPAGLRSVIVTTQNCGGNNAQVNVPTAGDSQQVVIPVNCAAAVVESIVAILQWGTQPSDLDSHLSGPDGPNARFHMAWFDPTPVAWVKLDRDVTTTLGPETTTITKVAGAFIPGDYRYWVHDFSGPTFAGSSAVVTILRMDPQSVPTQLAREEVVFAVGNQSDTIWHVANMALAANGTVVLTVIQTLQGGTTSTVL
jgi:uncharacterized protein YfaP (DUF2135 family)